MKAQPEAPLLLLFAYHFPPENAIGGVRPFRFTKYLSRQGVRSHTITQAAVSARPDLQAEMVPDPFISRPRQGLGWQLERLLRRFFLPGATGSQWARDSYQAACRYLEGQSNPKQTVVFSTYPPLGTALAAYWLAKRRRLPWILDFRDPMADNPGDQHLAGYQRGIYSFLERHFVASADCIIANTDAAQSRLQKKYPQAKDKIHLLWNGFDPEQRLMPLPVPAQTRRVYSHVGELYEGRIITPLLLSIGRLLDSGRLPADRLLIQLIGSVRPGSLPSAEFVAAATQQGWLKISSENVPQAEAHRITQESHGLLLVQPHSTLQVPGKLFEYIQIGRPILAYVLPDTPIERILRNSGIPSAFAYASSSEEDFDHAVLAFFQLDTSAVPPSDWFEQGFNVQHHAEQLFQIMAGLQAADAHHQAQSFETTTVSR